MIYFSFVFVLILKYDKFFVKMFLMGQFGLMFVQLLCIISIMEIKCMLQLLQSKKLLISAKLSLKLVIKLI